MLLRRRLTVLLATVMMLGVISVPVYSLTGVDPSSGELAKLGNNGNKVNDGADKNNGGGQEAPKKAKENQGGGND
jgi:hypothetical protein